MDGGRFLFFLNFLCEPFYRNIYQSVRVREFIPVLSVQGQQCQTSLSCHIQYGIKTTKNATKLTAGGQKCYCPPRSIIPLQEGSSNQPNKRLKPVGSAIGNSKENRKCYMKRSDSDRCKKNSASAPSMCLALH